MALIAQYLFKDNANDETGNYNGELGSNTTFASAPDDMNFGRKVMVLDGSYQDGGMILPPIESVSGTNARSYEWWLYASSYPDANSWARVVCRRSASSGTAFQFLPWHTSTRLPRFHVVGSYVDFAQVLSLNVWHHCVITVPKSSATKDINLFIDGVRQTQKTVSNNATINTANIEDNIGYGLAAKLGNLRIYNSVLTADEILQHYQTESSPPPSPLMS